MDEIAVRDARHDEARFIVQMIRHMVTDMADHGGHFPATDAAAWDKMSVAVAAELQGQTTKYVIAEATNGDRINKCEIRCGAPRDRILRSSKLAFRSSSRRQGPSSRDCLHIVAHDGGRADARRTTTLSPARVNAAAVPVKIFDVLLRRLRQQLIGHDRRRS
jgi:hypothetical protein